MGSSKLTATVVKQEPIKCENITPPGTPGNSPTKYPISTSANFFFALPSLVAKESADAIASPVAKESADAVASPVAKESADAVASPVTKESADAVAIPVANESADAVACPVAKESADAAGSLFDTRRPQPQGFTFTPQINSSLGRNANCSFQSPLFGSSAALQLLSESTLISVSDNSSSDFSSPSVLRPFPSSSKISFSGTPVSPQAIRSLFGTAASTTSVSSFRPISATLATDNQLKSKAPDSAVPVKSIFGSITSYIDSGSVSVPVSICVRSSVNLSVNTTASSSVDDFGVSVASHSAFGVTNSPTPCFGSNYTMTAYIDSDAANTKFAGTVSSSSSMFESKTTSSSFIFGIPGCHSGGNNSFGLSSFGYPTSKPVVVTNSVFASAASTGFPIFSSRNQPSTTEKSGFSFLFGKPSKTPIQAATALPKSSSKLNWSSSEKIETPISNGSFLNKNSSVITDGMDNKLLGLLQSHTMKKPCLFAARKPPPQKSIFTPQIIKSSEDNSNCSSQSPLFGDFVALESFASGICNSTTVAVLSSNSKISSFGTPVS